MTTVALIGDRSFGGPKNKRARQRQSFWRKSTPKARGERRNESVGELGKQVENLDFGSPNVAIEYVATWHG